jgi:hypothetical protein
VTRRSDAGALLETLCRQQVLLEPWDPAVPSYRFHRLFHEFLRHKLRTEAPAIARLSHLRAAAWCEAQQDNPASIRHLIAAGSHPEAVVRGLKDVVGILDGRYLPGEASLAVTDLPEGFVDRDPLGTCVVAAAHLAGLRPGEAAARLRALERYCRNRSDGSDGSDRSNRSDPPGLQARAELLWTLRAGLLGDPAGVLLHFDRAIHLGRSGPEAQTTPHGPERAPASASADPIHDLDRLLWRHLGALAAAAHLWLGAPDPARAAFRDDASGDGPLDHVDRLSGISATSWTSRRPGSARPSSSAPPPP